MIKESRTEILEGAIQACNAVASTMGPYGRFVAIHSRDSDPLFTKDGVMVANHVFLQDHILNFGAKLVADACRRTVQEAGDGTTTTAVLVKALIEEFREDEPREVRDLLREEEKKIVSQLTQAAQPVEDLEQVATISANGDQEIGKKIAELVKEVGPSGVIQVLPAKYGDREITTEVRRGYSYKGTSHRKELLRVGGQMVPRVTLRNPKIVLIEEVLDDEQQLTPLYDYFIKHCAVVKDGRVQEFRNELLVVCPTLEGSAVSFAIKNSHFPVYFVQAPTSGNNRLDVLEDIRYITGANRVFSSYYGEPIRTIGERREGKRHKDFGSAQEVHIDGDYVTILHDKDSADRVRQIEELEASDEEESKFLEERISKLTSGLGFIYVGASSDSEVATLIMLCDDAQLACLSALRGGVVDAGGWSLINLDVDKRLKKVLYAPLVQVCKNGNIGVPTRGPFNIVTMEAEDMKDPAEVLKSAIRNAFSVAAQLLNTNYGMISK